MTTAPVKLKLSRRHGGWWITGHPDPAVDVDCGPYKTMTEAREDKAGLERFYKYENRRGYVTTEKKSCTSRSQD